MELSDVTLITKQRVLQLCPDKLTIYKNLQRNGYYCPSVKCSLMSIKFMRGCVFKTDFWLPKTGEISIYQSPDPPTCAEIASELHMALLKAVSDGDWGDQAEKLRCKNTAELILKFPPNKEWALNVLGSILGRFDVQHPFFEKNYQKPTRIAPALDDQLVRNVANFFDGIPEPKRKGKTTRCSLVCESKQQRVQKALEKLRIRKQKVEARMAALMQQFQDDELELVEASQRVGTKRKRGQSVGPNVDSIEEEKKEPRQLRSSPRNKQQKSPSQGNMQLRRGVRNITSTSNPITGSAELVNQTANLSLRESQMKIIGKFKAGDSPGDKSNQGMEVDM